MFHEIQVDTGQIIYIQVLNLGILQKEGGKKDTRWLIFPREIYGILQNQHTLVRKARENLVAVIPYKNDSRLGEEYLKN